MSIPYNFQIEGASGEYSSEIEGYIFTVTIKLDEVPGNNDVAQMFNALTDSNVPLVGTDLSGVNLDLTGCWLRGLSTTPLGNNQWRVALRYQHSPFNRVQVSTQTQVSEVESNKGLPDFNNPTGKPVTLIYKYPATYGGDEPTDRERALRGTFSDEQGGTFSKLVPESTRTYTVRQAIDGDEIARDFIGTVNEAPWQGGDTGTWMLTSVIGMTDNSQQSPLNWVNSYTFQYKGDRWEPEVVFVDSNTNEPVPDPADSYVGKTTGSRVTVEAYEFRDFSQLFPATDP